MRLSLLLLLAGTGLVAQPTAEFTPATSNVPGAAYPQLDAQNRAIFQLKAPAAQQVAVQLPQGRYELAKSADGVWRVTTPPLEPGLHYYTFSLDGVAVNDPGSRTFYGTSKDSGGLEVPEPGVDFYAAKDVPHGELRVKRYFSSVTKSWRQLVVYTPPGYDADPAARFPVLYLQHGGGEDETGWGRQGCADLILDNLIEAQRAVPMVVVMANGNLPAAPGQRPGYSRAGMKAFADELLSVVVPFVETHYRVRTDAAGRALAGLSMGGGQTFIVGLANKDRFGALGVFSSGLFGGIAPPGGGPVPAFDAEAQVPGLLTDSASFRRALRVFYLSVGEQDPRIEFTRRAVTEFRAHGLDVAFASFPGGHEWQVWRKSLHDFVPRLFR